MPNEQVHAICEQGDMGLWDTELSPEDQKKYKDQEKEKDTKEDTKKKEA